MKKISTLIAMASFAFLGTGNSGYAQQGASLNFDGSNDHVNLGMPLVNTFTANPNITVEAWVNPGTTAGLGNIVGNYNTTTWDGDYSYTLRRDGNQYSFYVNTGLSSVTASTGAGTVLTNSWHHVAATWDGTTVNIYLDGNLMGSAGLTGTGIKAIAHEVWIGGNQMGSENFLGSIDEVKIWNTTRPVAMIQQYMNCSVQDTAVGLAAYYRFNDGVANGNNGSATTLFDAGVNKYNGALANFTLSGATSNFSTDYFMNYLSLQSTLTDANCGNTLGGAVAADFNGDGSKDLIMIDWNGLTRMYTNDGKGNFSSTYTNPITGGGVLEAVDADNDSDMDLVVAGGGTVTVYANNGSGTFTAVTGNFFQGTGSANVTKMADLNGDGKKDLIVGNGGSGATDSSLIYYNTGTTGNAAFTYKFGIAPNPGRNAIDVGDVNGDTYPDIITGGGSWGAQLLFNVNNGASFAMQTPPAGYSGGARFVDWNQDGKLDYVNYDQYNNYGLHYVLNDGTGHFNGTSTILLQDYNAHYAKLADLNGDGFLDAVIDNWGGNAKAYLSNGCALTLQNSCSYSLGRADNNIALADFNGDGKTDIFCQARCNSSSIYLNYLDPVVGTPLPNVTVSGNTLVNYGSSTVLTASGATAFQWSANAGSATTASVSVNPTSVTVYTVVGTNTVGCSSSKTVTVSINAAALNFDGSNDYVASGSSIVHNNQFTYEAWINSPTPNDWGGIMTTSSIGHNQWVQFTLTGGGRLKIEIVDDAGNNKWYEGTTTLVNDGSWHHVAATYDGNNNIQMYVDGIQQALYMQNNATLGSITINAPLYVGAERNLGPRFNGSIDEARIWNRALCQGEIVNNMNGELHLPQNGLIAYYKFNEGVAGSNNSSVTTLIDSSGNALNGTLNNFALTGTASNWIAPGGVTTGSYVPAFVAPSVSVSGTTLVEYGSSTVLTASGTTSYQWSANAGSATTATVSVSPAVSPTTYTVIGTTSGCVASATVAVNLKGDALNFDGTSTTVDLGMGITNALTGGNQVTAEAWVAPTTSVSTGATIVNNHQNTTQFLLGINGSSYYFFIGFGAFSVNTPSGVVTPGAWQHVAGVYDGSSLKIYVNGVLQGTTAVSPTLIFPASATTTKLGSDAFGEYFDGSIDEVRIWNRALCPGELQNNMNGELKLPQTGLLGYYHLNNGIASANNAGVTTAPDSSGNGYNGTLQNFTLNGATSNWIAPGGVMTGSYVATYVTPTLTVTGATAICSGDSAVLTATGADTYTWTSGPSTASYTVHPTGNATYTVNGTSNGCPTNMTQATVTVNPVPTITSESGNVHVCDGNSGTFTVNSPGSGDTYQWYWFDVTTPGTLTADIGTYTEVNYNTNSMTINVLDLPNWGPSGAWGVTCIITGQNGCSKRSTSDTIFINALPNVQATVSSATLCIGFGDTLTATGASTYTWSTNASSATTASVVVSPTSNDSYTVTGTDNNGCANTATVSITVNNCGTEISSMSAGKLNLYPNPGHGKFVLDVPSGLSVTKIKVLNVLGSEVYSRAFNNDPVIDLYNQENGVYFVIVETQGAKTITKIIKE